jgi:hypothetical protein
VTGTSFSVPAGVVATTVAHLRAKGLEESEGVVLWQGTFDPPRITAVIVPEQETSAGRFRVPLAERQRIARMLAGTGEMIVAQVHSHPHHAFHSWIDDEEAIPRRVGSYSLVVPDFGARPHLLDDAALFELQADGSWRPAALATFDVERPTSLPVPATPRRLGWLIATLKSFGRSRT